MLHTVVGKPDAMCKEKDLQFCENCAGIQSRNFRIQNSFEEKKKKEEKEWETVQCIILHQFSALEGENVANQAQFTSLHQIPELESARCCQIYMYSGKGNALPDRNSLLQVGAGLSRFRTR